MSVYLIALLIWIASLGITGWQAYEHGKTTEGNAIRAQLNDDFRKKIAERDADFNERMRAHDLQLRRDIWQGIKLDETLQRRHSAAAAGRHDLELDIARKNAELAALRELQPECPIRSCDLDPQSFGLLIRSIDRANSEAARGAEAISASGAVSAVPKNPETGERGRGNDPPMDR